MIFNQKKIKYLISIVLLCALIVGIGVLAYVRTKQGGHISSYSYIPIYPSPGDSQNSLQLKTFKFKKVQNSFECDNKAIQGSSEPYILWAMDPAPGTAVAANGKIKLWYNDERALTLGSSENVSPNTSDHITNPSVGKESAKDANGFPFFPAVFLTDTTNNPDDTSGDAEKGGVPHKPDEVWGTWKALGATDPAENGLILPKGADPIPATSNITFTDNSYKHRSRETSFSSEVIWDVAKLGLTSGHTYRAQFIVHDGDRDGDIGMGCTTILY